MSFLNSLFNKSKSERKTGVYIIQDEKLIELESLPENGSINAITKSLGFNNSQAHSILLFDSKVISGIIVKVFTKEILFILTEEGISSLNNSTLQSEIKNIDWDEEYSSYSIEGILSDGIDNKEFTYDFLNSVIELDQKSDSIYYSINLDLLLYFENDYLIKYSSADGYNAEAKEFKSSNPKYFDAVLSEAKSFQVSKSNVINEVNHQFKALFSIPNALRNEHLEDYKNELGNYNFFNLWVANYGSTSLSEFLNINKGRYIKLSDNLIKVNNTTFEFSEDGIFLNAWLN